MAISTYLITTADFTSRADLSGNILTSKIQAQIGPVQEIYGIKILCREFYDEVIAAQTTPTAAITAMMPYLKDFLVYKTYAEYLVGASGMMTPSGMRVQTDTTSEPASDKMVSEVMRQASNRANFYQDTLINFLTLNVLDYSTWEDSMCGCGDRRVTKNNQLSIIGTNKTRTPIEWT
ncbi:MAG: hypothetical protein O2887_10400 [Bacteroidetes bacterium]|nr:hypothetical protein [Bacteroidota bacterium]